MNRREFLARAGTGAALVSLAQTSRAEASANAAAAADWPRDLASHRIAKIDAWSSNDRYTRSLGPNSRGNPLGRGYGRQFRTLTTDQGATGFGMSGASDAVIRKLVGARVSDLFAAETGTSPEADPLDLALYDLAGAILQKPVYEILGAKGPIRLPIYSGAIYMDDLIPLEKPRGVRAVVDACRQDYVAGYRAFKLKIGRGAKWIPGEPGLRRDVEVTRAVREACPDCKILVDANDAYACDDFLKYVTAVADCDLFFIEEPFAENRDDLKRLRDHMARVGCKALIADGEGRSSAADEIWKYGGYAKEWVDNLYALAAEGLVDVFVFDLAIVGFSRWRHVMPELVEAGVKAAPHLWGGTPRPFYCAHLGAGVGNVLIVEGIPGVGTGLDYGHFQIDGGDVVVPKVPGFGIVHT